jgi:sugar phosphate isomerase/epimerase
VSLRFGLQLYSLEAQAKNDLIGTLHAVAVNGFEGVEFAGFHGVELPRIKQALLETGLQIAGSVHEFSALEHDLEGIVRQMQTLECPTVVMPWLDEHLRSSGSEYERTAQRLEKIGHDLRSHDLRFLVHLHGYEFQTFETNTGTKTGLELLMQTDPNAVGLELDTFWVLQGGADPLTILQRYAARCPSLHCKDTLEKITWTECEAGAGLIDFAALLEHFSGWAIIEQEHFNRDPLESVTQGLRNLREIARKVKT